MKGKLVIVMVGLPARGKSTMARKLGRTLEMDGVRVRIFNNGELRRKLDTVIQDGAKPEALGLTNLPAPVTGVLAKMESGLSGLLDSITIQDLLKKDG